MICAPPNYQNHFMTPSSMTFGSKFLGVQLEARVARRQDPALVPMSATRTTTVVSADSWKWQSEKKCMERLSTWQVPQQKQDLGERLLISSSHTQAILLGKYFLRSGWDPQNTKAGTLSFFLVAASLSQGRCLQ